VSVPGVVSSRQHFGADQITTFSSSRAALWRGQGPRRRLPGPQSRRDSRSEGDQDRHSGLPSGADRSRALPPTSGSADRDAESLSSSARLGPPTRWRRPAGRPRTVGFTLSDVSHGPAPTPASSPQSKPDSGLAIATSAAPFSGSSSSSAGDSAIGPTLLTRLVAHASSALRSASRAAVRRGSGGRRRRALVGSRCLLGSQRKPDMGSLHREERCCSSPSLRSSRSPYRAA
jgi:hypothetical protein